MREINHIDYYDVLDIPRNASVGTVRDSYRRLMQQGGAHPDRGGDAATAALINKAYAVLSDATQRRAYDAHLQVIEHAAGLAAAAGKLAVRRAGPDPARNCLFCGRSHKPADIENGDSSCTRCDSPLTAAKNLSLERSDQRGVHRISKSLNLRFFTQWPQRRAFVARSENVSLSGLRMVTRQALPHGQRIRLVSDLVNAVGTIMYCDTRRSALRAEYDVGVAFLTLSFVRSVGGFLSQRA